VAEGVRLVELLDNPQTERIKRAYFTYLAEAKGFSETTLDGVAKALNRFETYTKFRDFKAFHIEQAKGFKASLAEQTSLRTKDHLSKATLYATLSDLKRFFVWLAGQPGYKSRISYSDAEYFNLSAKETSGVGLAGASTPSEARKVGNEQRHPSSRAFKEIKYQAAAHYSVTAGRTALGTIEQVAGGFVATDASGRVVGTFSTLSAASRAFGGGAP